MTHNPNCSPWCEGDHAPDGRCPRCRNWLVICGHDLPLAERIKTIKIDRSSLR